jgi:hypothetical protein
MATISRVLNRAFRAAPSAETETLRQLVLLAGAGFVVSLVLMTYGLDLSAGFF